MYLSVVVPVHNEVENLSSLIDEINAALAGAHDYEIIYVDDGSTDGTLLALKELLRQTPGLRVIEHGQCCGQSTALLTGVKAARGMWIATLDGDGQNDPADIPKLLEALHLMPLAHAQAGMVAGYRKKRQDSEWRRFSSRVANTIRARLLGDDTPDTGCGLKVFPRELFLKLPYFDHMHRFLPALAQRAGAVVISVEVNHRPRTRGVSKYGTWQRLKVGIIDLMGVMWLKSRSFNPETLEHLDNER